MAFFSKELPRFNAHLVSLQDPTCFEAEQYRRLRHQIEHLGAVRGVRVIAVTSAVPNDGKTLTAINLAGSLAQAQGARILLIDADLRRPSVAQQLDLGDDASQGLVAALQGGRRPLADFVRVIDGTNLSVLACPKSEAGTYELLTSPGLVRVLSQARCEYDFVVVDTPPVIPVPDGTLLSRAVDGYLIVVSAGSTPRKLLAETLNMLEPSSVMGLVLNCDDQALFGQYGSRQHRRYFRSYAESLNRSPA